MGCQGEEGKGVRERWREQEDLDDCSQIPVEQTYTDAER